MPKVGLGSLSCAVGMGVASNTALLLGSVDLLAGFKVLPQLDLGTSIDVFLAAGCRGLDSVRLVAVVLARPFLPPGVITSCADGVLGIGESSRAPVVRCGWLHEEGVTLTLSLSGESSLTDSFLVPHIWLVEEGIVAAWEVSLIGDLLIPHVWYRLATGTRLCLVEMVAGEEEDIEYLTLASSGLSVAFSAACAPPSLVFSAAVCARMIGWSQKIVENGNL